MNRPARTGVHIVAACLVATLSACSATAGNAQPPSPAGTAGGTVLALPEATVGASPGSTQRESPTPQPVTRFEITEQLRQLTQAVVAYTDTDYTAGGDVAITPELLNTVATRYSEVKSKADRWRAFTKTIDYSTTAIPGLEQAIEDYDAGLTAWQTHQEQGMKKWQRCIDQGGGEMTVLACTLDGFSMEDEQAVLNDYVTPLKQLMRTLGLMT